MIGKFLVLVLAPLTYLWLFISTILSIFTPLTEDDVREREQRRREREARRRKK